MQRLNILGLKRKELKELGIDSKDQLSGAVWTVNDWVRVYPWLTEPDAVFNLHSFSRTMAKVEDSSTARFPEDYLLIVEDSNAEYVVPENQGWHDEMLSNDITYLSSDNTDYLPEGSTGCAIATMIGIAAHRGFSEIQLYGVYLDKEEYVYQIGSVLKAIQYAEKEGCAVKCSRRREWETVVKTNPFLKDESIGMYWDLTRKELDVYIDKVNTNIDLENISYEYYED